MNAQQNGQSAISSADELKKFKELLDMGVITQEEFDQKKKQLLGL
ncbi:MAG: SHOCT domain-containing protein [Clostridia bacterium]|nr:SHOCT domain-containing protein [Clostridia bacterium]